MGRKRKKNIEETNADIGPVMTVSLFLILLTFFIMLNSIAVLDERKVRASIGSILSAFGSFTGGFSASKSGEMDLSPTSPMVSKTVDLATMMEISNKEIKGEISIKSTKGRGMITFSKKYLFDKDKLKLKDSSYAALNKLCNFINIGDYPVEIVGHTDNMPAQPKGYHSNWTLSAMMAQEVAQYLKTAGKISDKRLSAYGAGSYSQIVPNDTSGSRAQNRRVDIILKYGASDYIKRIYKEKPPNIFTFLKFDFKVFE